MERIKVYLPAAVLIGLGIILILVGLAAPKGAPAIFLSGFFIGAGAMLGYILGDIEKDRVTYKNNSWQSHKTSKI